MYLFKIILIFVALFAFVPTCKLWIACLRWKVRRRVLKLRLQGKGSYEIINFLYLSPSWDIRLLAFFSGRNSRNIIDRYAHSYRIKRRAQKILAAREEEIVESTA